MHHPECDIIQWAGTAKSANDLAASKLENNSAVIANKNCAVKYGLQTIKENIQDLGPDNETLFLLITGNKNGARS